MTSPDDPFAKLLHSMTPKAVLEPARDLSIGVKQVTQLLLLILYPFYLAVMCCIVVLYGILWVLFMPMRRAQLRRDAAQAGQQAQSVSGTA